MQWLESQRQSDELFDLVLGDAIYARPIAERHRLIFYLGHLEAFDWNLLAGRAFGLAPFHAVWDRLFAFGIDPVDGQLPTDQPEDWPRPAEVREYNRKVRSELEAGLRRTPEKFWKLLLPVAVEHRQMHMETLAYLLHQLPYEQKQAGPTPSTTPSSSAGRSRRAQGSVAVPAGTATLGRKRLAEDAPNWVFGWDNEFEEQEVQVPLFRADRFKVTNGDFLEFVDAKGYQNRDYWTAASWEWKLSQGIEHPHFWTQAGAEWRYKGMFAEVPLPLDHPVYVAHAEAEAYCRWTGKSLPSEAQWHRMAFGTSAGREHEYPWGDEATDGPEGARGNFDYRHWDPVATDAHPAGRSTWGVEDLLGNGWEWTSTPFGPLPGFRAFEFYPGYSANFFDGKHFVLKGGSPRTAWGMLRRSFRNWFQPHYPYIYAGFRSVTQENN